MFTRYNLISAPDKILVLVAIFVSFLVKNFSLDSMLLVVGCNLSCFFVFLSSISLCFNHTDFCFAFFVTQKKYRLNLIKYLTSFIKFELLNFTLKCTNGDNWKSLYASEFVLRFQELSWWTLSSTWSARRQRRVTASR